MRSRVGRRSPDSDDGERGGGRMRSRVGRHSPDSDDGGRGDEAGGREDGDLGAVWGRVCGPGRDKHACELSRHSAMNLPLVVMNIRLDVAMCSNALYYSRYLM